VDAPKSWSSQKAATRFSGAPEFGSAWLSYAVALDVKDSHPLVQIRTELN
jgi:hypothetical protein